MGGACLCSATHAHVHMHAHITATPSWLRQLLCPHAYLARAPLAAILLACMLASALYEMFLCYCTRQHLKAKSVGGISHFKNIWREEFKNRAPNDPRGFVS